MPATWHQRLADRIHAIVEEKSSRLEIYRVVRVAPLKLDQVDGDEVLEEGDDDVTIGALFTAHGAAVGDRVRVLRQPDGWHVIDIDGTAA